jgi:hypothetical protein
MPRMKAKEKVTRMTRRTRRTEESQLARNDN